MPYVNTDAYKAKAAAVSDMLNNGTFNYDAFCEALSREHRTLQQNFTRLCFAWIQHCANDDYATDLRNEASHIKCKRIVDTMESADTSSFYVPYI